MGKRPRSVDSFLLGFVRGDSGGEMPKDWKAVESYPILGLLTSISEAKR
ncbi:MAG: hypothetical protein LRY73_01030 [Bacillus sp. (in: Bacteria)]|nr:hypothetical protein [Bacillus sp. (in: firmicutes)]